MPIEPRSSLGFGGTAPAGRTASSLWPHGWMRSSSFCAADQSVRDAGRAVDAQHLGHARTTEVAVDDDDRCAALGDGDGEVRRGRRLALAGDRARHDECAFVGSHVEELQVGAEGPERLGARAPGLGVHHQGGLRGVRVEADRSDHRDVGDVGDVRGAVHPRVECVAEQEHTDAGEEAADHGQRSDDAQTRAAGVLRRDSRLDRPDLHRAFAAG
ncbi:hypothetical protein P9139_07005 [Curtobacterium flaccumfaciens]|nr:hypothetical protein P9139_07005 [Curtobacterium flaccumfaciens]